MSKMYGKLRVVLEKRGVATICGSDSPSAIRPGTNSGCYFPIGYWYQDKDNGLYYVDLKSPEQLYRGVTRFEIANKRFAGVPSKASLRKFILDYWKRRDSNVESIIFYKG
jgi:hypothetical protein